MTIKKSIPLPINLVFKKIALFIGVISTFGWTLKVFRHHFDFHPSDLLPLSLCFVLPFLLIKTLGIKVKTPSILAILIIPVLLITLLPLTRWFLSFTDYSWSLCYIVLLVSGVLLFSWRGQWTLLPISLIVVWSLPYAFDGNQGLYFDKLVSSESTRKAEIHQVSWKSEKWHYVNGRPEFSTVDQHMYFEPLVHPIMHLKPQGKVLLVGGDNQKALEEIRKFAQDVEWIAWDQERVGESTPQSIFQSLTSKEGHYSAIIIDLPDPTSMQLNEYYTSEFYSICFKALQENGLLVTQSLSPYSKSGLSKIIENTLRYTSFETLQYHNQVPTLGQWSWTIGAKSMNKVQLRSALSSIKPKVKTVWWNQEAMQMMLSGGKHQFFYSDHSDINSIESPLLHTALNATL